MSAEVRELVRKYLPDFPIQYCRSLVTDTTQFMSIDYGNVIRLNDMHYMVYKNEAERRFGLEDPKYWVKRCHELETGQRKILKLEFFETFPVQVGRFSVECYRSPDKESRILEIVRDDERFMQGVTVKDAAGRNVRILEIVNGRRLDVTVDRIDLDHQTYFRERLPGLLRKYLEAIRAIGMLHQHGERHGDIRRDHLYMEFGTEHLRWIDFDYTFHSYEHPFGLDLFGLGNILVFLVGKANITVQSIESMGFAEQLQGKLSTEDLSIVIPNRIVNLRKIYPYIPEALNNVLMHFSNSAEIFYNTTDDLLADLVPCIEALEKEFGGAAPA
ncbi:serine/threonine protein kinase [Desulfovibrio mangrovi]|uniref:serine/threonine protein kinase n=1 Tax=Desulfovibrio mangrovi TaxID=2976983 RepID=UPI0022479444|nr:serine/threonine protein kinase [Desulfovibrio mangrovi]UZP65892.1 serine/threonine protein kinase [Desulfovibrio mangrovi]